MINYVLLESLSTHAVNDFLVNYDDDELKVVVVVVVIKLYIF